MSQRSNCKVCGRYEHEPKRECFLCTCQEPDFVYDGLIHHECRVCGGTIPMKLVDKAIWSKGEYGTKTI